MHLQNGFAQSVDISLAKEIDKQAGIDGLFQTETGATVIHSPTEQAV